MRTRCASFLYMACVVALFMHGWAYPIFAEPAAEDSGPAQVEESQASFEKRMNSYRESLQQGEKEEPLASVGMSMARNLAIIVGLFLVGSFFYKKYIYKGNRQGSGENMLHVVERIGLGPKASLYLVRVQEKHLVLAVTDANVTQISTESDVLARADFAKVEEEVCSEISQVG